MTEHNMIKEIKPLDDDLTNQFVLTVNQKLDKPGFNGNSTWTLNRESLVEFLDDPQLSSADRDPIQIALEGA